MLSQKFLISSVGIYGLTITHIYELCFLIGDLHREQASSYRSVIRSRAEEAVKNAAASQVTVSQSSIEPGYVNIFTQRKQVEAALRSAIEDRFNSPPRVHCRLDQFHLGFIKISESVASKMLETRVQNERNDREEFLQEARSEREKTTVEVNKINLSTNKTLRTAEAEASLIRTKALAEAQLIKAHAEINGTRMLLVSAGIESQEQKTVFTYIKTLRDRKQLDMVVSYLRENDDAIFTMPV